MELEVFIGLAAGLTPTELTATAEGLESASATAAGEVARWHAIVEIERCLRRHRVGRTAGLAAHRAAEAVLGAARDGGLELADRNVIAVARAAGDVARGLVAGNAALVGVPLEAWQLPVAA